MSATLAAQVQVATVACTILGILAFLARRSLAGLIGYLAAIPMSWTVARPRARRYAKPARYRGRHVKKGRHML